MSSAAPSGGNGVGIAQFFDRMLEAVERSVRVQTRLLIQGKRNGEKIDNLAEAVKEGAVAAREGRDAAVEELKEHVGNVVKLELASSTRWERRFLIIMGVLVVLSNLLGQPVGDWIDRLFKIGP